MKFGIWIIRLIMFFMGIPLMGFAALYFHGSLEMFPTEEQHGKIRIISSLFIIIIMFAEVCLFLCQKKMNQSVNKKT